MISKIFWAFLLLAIYLGLMLSGNDHFLKSSFDKAYEYVSYLLEDLEIYR